MIKLEETYSPSVDLTDYIVSYNFYQVKPSVQSSYMVPEGLVELIFQFDSIIHQSEWSSDRWVQRGRVFMAGLHKKSFNLKVSQGGYLLSVRFRPGAAAHFIECPVNEIQNLMIGFENLWKLQDGKDLSDQIQNAQTNQQKITVIEKFLKKQFRNHRYADMCRAALYLIVPPFSKIDDLSNKYNLSRSRFRDLFGRVIGCSPKQFHRTRRINCIIGEHDKANSLTALAFKYGYFDQPHFIHDFKSVTGFTPSGFSRKSLLHNPALLNS